MLFHCMSKAFSLGIWNNPCIVVQIFMMNKNRWIKLTGYLLLHKLLPRCVLVCRTKRAPLECSSQCTAPTRKRETIESWMVNSGERRKEIKRAKNRRRTVFMAEIQGEEWKCGKDYSLPLTSCAVCSVSLLFLHTVSWFLFFACHLSTEVITMPVRRGKFERRRMKGVRGGCMVTR